MAYHDLLCDPGCPGPSQLVVNCVGHPERLARFRAETLGYVLEPPPAGFVSDLSEELDEGLDHYAVALRDPEGNEFDIN